VKRTDYEDDHELVARAQSGDTLAFEELVRKYQHSVLNLVQHNIGHRADVEDVAQEIFAKVYFSLSKFDGTRPFFPWLYRIAINQCYDELRRTQRRKVHTFTDLNLEETEQIDRLMKQHETPAESPGDTEDLRAILHKMLDSLPAQQRAALVLHDLESVPYEKVAEILECTEQAARLKVFRARVRLRELTEKALRRRERLHGR
jgi:RNA polymerase sigma-70 factor (ECF subfamily)